MSNSFSPAPVGWKESLDYYIAMRRSGHRGPALKEEFSELMEAIDGVLNVPQSGEQPSADAIAACASLLDHIVCASKGPVGPF